MSAPMWMIVAKGYLGQKEISGTKHNPLIVKMWSRIRAPFTDDETPWCAAFVGSCLEEANFKSSRSAGALSYRTWGQPISVPVYGAIAYMSRKNKAGKVVGGHVTFVAGIRRDGLIMCLGGNQGDKVSIAPFLKERILGYRWPSTEALPNPRAELPMYNNIGQKISSNEA